MDGVSLTGSWRPVEQYSLFYRQAQLPKLLALSDETTNVAIEKLKGSFRQDHLVPTDISQLVYAQDPAPSGIVVGGLKRDDLSTVRRGLSDQHFKPIKEAT